MNPEQHMLAERIEVGQRFLRSVSLEKDYPGTDLNGDYIVTPPAREALQRLADGLVSNSPARAWTLTGPYGVGKSSFAVFLTRVMCADSTHGKAACRELAEADPRLAKRVGEIVAGRNEKKGMLPILVTARRAPASQCIAEGILSSLSSIGNRQVTASGRKLAALLTGHKNGDGLDSRRVVEAIASLSEAGRAVGYAGILLIVDELGKLFEYAARHPQRGDVYVLQELAEYAVRSGNNPLVVVGLLHQSFEEYGQHLDIGTRREWAKIQGRFEDIPFLEPAEQVMRLIAKALRWKKPGLPDSVKRMVKEVVSVAAKCNVMPPGMSQADFLDVALAAYPLHPASLVAMPYVFRRFAQNERSLFSYLSSLEPNAFQEFIRTHKFDPAQPVFVRLSDLFDYFTRNLGAGLYRQPHARRWIEAVDMLDRKESLTPIHRNLVKTIGILNALGEFCHLRASEAVISVAAEDRIHPSNATKDALRLLQEQSVVTHRSFNETYRIWEGSDVDVDERISEGERKLRHALDLAGSVQRYLPRRPLVARKHSFETGALRYYDVGYIDRPDDIQPAMTSDSDADGKVIVCLAESGSVAEAFRHKAREASAPRNILFAIPQQIGELRAAVTELGALRWVWENTPELRDDRVARREVALRITEAEQILIRNLGGLLDPRPEPIGSGCLWFHEGHPQKVAALRDVSELLSDVCDRIYVDSPRVRNELITRRSLSSAAAAARRTLIERMLLHPGEPLLGIEGYPPERSMYESVLAATGIHGQNEAGQWRFSPPSKSRRHNLLPCWNALHEMIFTVRPEPLPVVEAFNVLSAPPYGLREGLHPVILCAFMMAYRDETTLYREGTFIPEPGVADFEVLIRRPELFAVAGCHVTGGRAAVVERLAKGLHVKPATVPVVRALFAMVKGLPEFAWQTRSLPEATRELREAFRNAKSPEKFLFVDVPQALRAEVFTDQAASSSQVESFFRALNGNLQVWARKTPDVIRHARDALLEACGMPRNDAGWEELRRQCLRVEGGITEVQLLAFVRRVIQVAPDDVGVQSVLALVANRPPQTWADVDVERFPVAAAAIGRAFRDVCRTTAKGGGPARTYDSLDRKQKAEADFLLRKLKSSPLAHQARSKKALIAALEMLIEEMSKREERK
jgi:hypothetical protein